MIGTLLNLALGSRPPYLVLNQKCLFKCNKIQLDQLLIFFFFFFFFVFLHFDFLDHSYH